MPDNDKRIIRIIDNAIVLFFIVFLLSLTDSIFVNQLGYYGAFLLIIAKGIISKENPFQKTGMEFAFLWFILAEILSLIFTKEPGNDIIFLLRRVLLIPIVYTVIASSFNIRKAKLYLKIYLGFSLVSILIYLYFSAHYLMYGLFNIKQSGPSIFQYPITVSEITSFTVVILFAFLINERINLKNRVFLFLAFALSSLALLSTYKRTGWTGAAFGILIILIIKKKWRILVPGVLIVGALFVLGKNKSALVIYDYYNNKISNEQVINTPGRAYNVFTPDSSTCLVCDFQNGIILFHGNKIVQRIELPAPVISIKRWNDSSYIANLIDTRFILLNEKENKLLVKGEFITPGYTSSYDVVNGCLYILDSDSGLNVFRNPDAIYRPLRYPEISGFENMYVDSTNMILYSPQKGVGVFTLQNHLPIGKINAFENIRGISVADITSGKFVVSHNDGLRVYKINTPELKLIYTEPKIKDGFRIFNKNDRTFILTSERELFETVINLNSTEIVSLNRLNFTPFSLSVNQDKIYFTYFKENRLISIFDPYNPSNFNRIALWEAGIKMFKDHPVFGVGDIDLANLYRQYKHPWNKEIQGHLHNNFFHILATLGLFGLAAVCFLFFKYLKISFRIYKERITVPFVSSVALGVIGSFCAFLVSGLTELNFWDHEIVTLIWFLFGLNFALYKMTEKSKR
jgi:O-antigen ligase